MKTANIRNADGSIREVEACKFFRFKIGGRVERFFTHEEGNDTALSHYKTGGKVANLNGVKVIGLAAGGSLLSDRMAAELSISKLVSKIGEDKFLETLDKVIKEKGWANK